MKKILLCTILFLAAASPLQAQSMTGPTAGKVTARNVTAGNVTEKRLAAGAGEAANWLVKGGNARGQHYSRLARIDAENVQKLGLAWVTDIPVPDGIAGTPIVVDGVIYLSAAWSRVYALDAATGRIRWQYDPGVRERLAAWPRLSWTARAQRGVAVLDGRVFVTTADCRLLALDAATGERDWSVVTCDPEYGYGISDSPYVGAGKVFVGNNGSESGSKNRGYVSAYDPDSGELVWRFYTVPSANPEENTTAAMKMAAATWSGDALEKFGGGGSNWNEMTYDPESRLLYFGTAGALPYVHALRSPDGGDNLFLSSVIAVDADTGEYVWHYQTVPQDSWEYNATMNIVLDDIEIGGKERKVLMIAPKNGFHYVLDRRTGELLAADKFARVNWASHVNPETGRPVYLPGVEYWRADAGDGVRIWPNMWGAHGWQPMARHPGLGLTYIPVADVPTVVTDYADGDFLDTLELVTEIDGEPFSPGKLVAFDPVAGKPRWSVDHALPFNGGVLATAGGLVFQGDAGGRFSAYAAGTGERLWSFDTGSAIQAAPVSYASGGEQFIAVAVGSAGGTQFSYPRMHAARKATGPTRLLAFSLDGRAELPAHTPVPRAAPDTAGPAVPADVVETGRRLYASSCKGCHGKEAAARAGGTPPDLRYSSAATHEQWQAIVIGGARRGSGMPAFELSVSQSEAIRAYVLDEAAKLGEEQAGAR